MFAPAALCRCPVQQPNSSIWVIQQGLTGLTVTYFSELCQIPAVQGDRLCRADAAPSLQSLVERAGFKLSV